MLDTSIFTVTGDRVDRALVMAFLADQATERLFLESTTVEFKREGGANVVQGICAMANADGGIIFVGVDEKTPTQAPGVLRAEYDRLVNQCRTILQPMFFPEIIPVPADADERVILVVRVAAQPSLQPVFCRGAVFIRVPGSTVRANRDQVISMVHGQARQGMAIPGEVARALASTYYPPEFTGDPQQQPPLPDLRLRAAGAFTLRPETRGRLLLGTHLRRSMLDLIDQSTLVRWATGPDSRDVHPWIVEISRATVWRARRRMSRRFDPEEVYVSVETRGEPTRLSWAVDVDIYAPEARPTGTRSGGSAVLRLEHVVRGWLEEATLVGSHLPQFASDALGSPPLTGSEVVLWAVPRQADLKAALALEDLPHEVEDQRPLSILRIDLDSTQLEDLPDAMLAWLEHSLLDDGVTDAEVVASEILDHVRRRPVDAPWT